MSEFAFCLNTSTIRPVPLPDKVRLASAAGFTALEPWNVEVDDYLRDGGTLVDLRRMLDDAGLSVVSMIALGDWATTEGDAWDQARDECRRRMDQAAALGSPWIVASPPRGGLDFDLAARRFAELTEMGRAAGVRPLMEFLGFVEAVHTLASALRIADGSGDPEAAIVADVFHLLRGGGSLDDLLTIPGARLSIFHINDLPAEPPWTQQEDADRVMLGEGTADLPRVIANLRAIGYRGPLSLELFNHELWRLDPADVLGRGIERLRALVEA